MFRFNYLNNMSSFALLLCCACALVSCVRYSGASKPDAYLEYQNGRPMQDADQTRVFTFPHDGQYHNSQPLYDFTTRRPLFGENKPLEREPTGAPPCCGGGNQEVIIPNFGIDYWRVMFMDS